jgi:putative ABC transport system permease protein
MPTDSSSAFVLNETAVKQLGWGEPENAIGREFGYAGIKQGKIIGVVKDFHFLSLQKKIFPIVIHIDNTELKYISLKLSTEDLPELVNSVKETWQSVLSEPLVDYFFLDQDFNSQYNFEEKVSAIFNAFTFLAILIACLGLFGLASYVSEQRTKEIGIRKALGATISNVIISFSKEFIIWILIANVIAWPIA